MILIDKGLCAILIVIIFALGMLCGLCVGFAERRCEMSKAQDIVDAINLVSTIEAKKPILIARSDLEEKYFKEFYPGVEIIRAPQRIKESE